MTTQSKIRTKRGNSYNKEYYFTYEINKIEYWVQGDLYYNIKKSRYEHIHVGKKGGETLIFWTKKEFEN